MKTYNGEKAIISLTSWKARINTVSKTLFSLVRRCPGFHIVLVLSEEEFPKKEAELPPSLMAFVNSNLIEILWVYKNYKSFKKVLFTMDRYRDVPVISADDDCIYTCNYAEELYQAWLHRKDCYITYKTRPYRNNCHSLGCASLHPPYCYGDNGLKLLSGLILQLQCDDAYYSVLRERLHIGYEFIDRPWNKIVVFHDSVRPLDEFYSTIGNHIFAIYEKELLNEFN